MAAIRSVRDLLNDRLGVPLEPRYNENGTGVPANQYTSKLRNDPTRVAFVLVNVGGVPIHAKPANAPSPAPFGAALRLEPNGGTLIVTWEEDGEVVAYEWQCFGVAGGGEIWVMAIRLGLPAPGGGGTPGAPPGGGAP